MSVVDLVVIIGVRTPGQAHTQISIGTENPMNSQFGIEIDRGYGKTQGKVRAEKVWLVVIIKRVSRQGLLPLKGAIISELDKVAFIGVDLRPNQNREEPNKAEQHDSASIHAI